MLADQARRSQGHGKTPVPSRWQATSRDALVTSVMPAAAWPAHPPQGDRRLGRGRERRSLHDRTGPEPLDESVLGPRPAGKRWTTAGMSVTDRSSKPQLTESPGLLTSGRGDRRKIRESKSPPVVPRPVAPCHRGRRPGPAVSRIGCAVARVCPPVRGCCPFAARRPGARRLTHEVGPLTSSLSWDDVWWARQGLNL
jgi:hypothetical protein